MIIEQSSISVIEQPKRQNYFWPLILGTIITLTATTLPILFVVVKSDQPTGTLLSPIPEGVVTDSRGQALTLAENYLSKAYDLLRNPNQTEADKAMIKISLEKGLRLAPETTEGQGLRREILAEIRKLLPDTKASSSAEQNLIIAAPGEDSSSSGQTDSASNASQNRFILPAGQTEMTIKDTQVKTDSYIYLLPVENSSVVVSLLSKSSGSFTVSTDIPSATEIAVDYYIINE